MDKCAFPGCQEAPTRGFRLRPFPGSFVTCSQHGIVAEHAGAQARRAAVAGAKKLLARHVPNLANFYRRSRVE